MKSLLTLSLAVLAAPAWSETPFDGLMLQARQAAVQAPVAKAVPAIPDRIVCKYEYARGTGAILEGEIPPHRTMVLRTKAEFVLQKKKDGSGWEASYKKESNTAAKGENLVIGGLNICHFNKLDPKVFACHKGDRTSAWDVVESVKTTVDTVEWAGDGNNVRSERIEIRLNKLTESFSPADCKVE